MVEDPLRCRETGTYHSCTGSRKLGLVLQYNLFSAVPRRGSLLRSFYVAADLCAACPGDLKQCLIGAGFSSGNPVYSGVFLYWYFCILKSAPVYVFSTIPTVYFKICNSVTGKVIML